MRTDLRTLTLAVLTALSLGCGDDKPAEGDKADSGTEPEDSDKPYLPWTVGNTWTYRVTNGGEVTTKVVTIEEEEAVGGSGPHAEDMALRVVTKKGESDQTISWQARDGDRVLRYREQSFHATTGELELEEHWDPYKLHFDGTVEHTAAKASWLESYDETKIHAKDGSEETAASRDRWVVDSPEEEVTVPAGTFRAVVVQKAGGSDVKTYWYVRGVGKVKETGGQTEELVSYEVSP